DCIAPWLCTDVQENPRIITNYRHKATRSGAAGRRRQRSRGFAVSPFRRCEARPGSAHETAYPGHVAVDESLQEFPRAIAGDAAVVGDQLVLEVDEYLRLGQQGHVQVGKHVAQVLLAQPEV